MTASSGSSGQHAENRAGDKRRTWSVTRAIRRAISRGNARPTQKDARDRGVGHDRKWPLPPWTDRGERGQLPGRYGIRGVHPGSTHMEEMGPHGGRANQVLGAAVFGRRTSAGVPGQGTTDRGSRNPVGPSSAPVGPWLGLTGAHLGMLLGWITADSNRQG